MPGLSDWMSQRRLQRMVRVRTSGSPRHDEPQASACDAQFPSSGRLPRICKRSECHRLCLFEPDQNYPTEFRGHVVDNVEDRPRTGRFLYGDKPFHGRYKLPSVARTKQAYAGRRQFTRSAFTPICKLKGTEAAMCRSGAAKLLEGFMDRSVREARWILAPILALGVACVTLGIVLN